MAFILNDDGSRTDLVSEYDQAEDVMYSWVPPEPHAHGVAYETPDGHLVLLDPGTNELVGVTIFDFYARWGGGNESITLEWEVPDRNFIGMKRDRRVERVLQPA
jgi:hypothetical protein